MVNSFIDGHVAGDRENFAYSSFYTLQELLISAGVLDAEWNALAVSLEEWLTLWSLQCFLNVGVSFLYLEAKWNAVRKHLAVDGTLVVMYTCLCCYLNLGLGRFGYERLQWVDVEVLRVKYINVLFRLYMSVVSMVLGTVYVKYGIPVEWILDRQF